MRKQNDFEIIDEKGVIEGSLKSLEEAYNRLETIRSEVDFVGDIKIVEVHYIER